MFPFETHADKWLDTTLYFGCRSREKDHHYGEEWRAYEKRGELWYRVTFSRDGQEGERRIYVQDVMREEEEGKRIWRVLESGGWIFISG
jgi:sulfite reductase alpha subunit-like flavoprotein